MCRSNPVLLGWSPTAQTADARPSAWCRDRNITCTIFSVAESYTDTLVNFVSCDHRRGYCSRLLVGHIQICEHALERAWPAFDQWRLLICLLHFQMNGQTVSTYG